MQRNIPSDELYDHANHNQEYWISKHYKGWERLIRPCIDRAVEKKYHIQQIKAKLGSLRFYWTPSKKGGLLRMKDKDKEMVDMVAYAQLMSYRTCTNCGLEDATVQMGYCNLCKDGWFDRMVKEELK